MTLNRDRVIFLVVAPFVLLGYCAAMCGSAVRKAVKDFPDQFRAQWDALADRFDEGDHTNASNTDDLY